MKLSFRFIAVLLLRGLIVQSDRCAIANLNPSGRAFNQLRSIDEEALAERVRFFRHVLGISAKANVFFKVTRVYEPVTADGNVIGGFFFTGGADASGEGAGKQGRFVED